MFQQYTPQISRYLANALGVDASEIKIGEATKSNRFLDTFPFLLNGQEVARAYEKPQIERAPPRVVFKLPGSDVGKSYARFSVSHIGDFEISHASFTYHIDEHLEFLGVLEDLRVNYRIPGQKIALACEPSVSEKWDGILKGEIQYFLGTPRQKQGLCIPVEPRDVKYVPEADEQPEQGHHCIHGESAPVNPFVVNPKDSKKLSIVNISLVQHNFPNARKYLEETLEGLLVPADGLSLSGKLNRSFFADASVRLRTPSEPFIEISLYDPLSEENWKNKIKLARSLEEMFK